MSENNPSGANAAAAANPEPTTTTEATNAAVQEARQPFQSRFDGNKNSSGSAPVTSSVGAGSTEAAAAVTPDNTDVPVDAKAEPLEADTDHQASVEAVDAQADQEQAEGQE